MKMDLIDKLVAHPVAGAEISQMAEACYELSKELGVPVEFVHNDRKYTVKLAFVERTK